VASWATRFLFTKIQLDQSLKKMSGGEQSRVLIARLMLKPADLLLLDEPTNDLDIPSLEVLEQSLAEFPGALVLVTHDRYLLDRVSKQILALDGKGNAGFFADLSQWEDFRAQERVKEKAIAKQIQSEPVTHAPILQEKPKKTLSAKEQKEIQAMDEAIHAAEEGLKAAKARLEDPTIASDVAKLQERQKEVDAEQAKLDALFKRWEELEAKRNKAETR
jgi:ATP-binding cassette subfamily F protein uup